MGEATRLFSTNDMKFIAATRIVAKHCIALSGTLKAQLTCASLGPASMDYI